MACRGMLRIDCSCLISALLFILTNILGLVYLIQLRAESAYIGGAYHKFKDLDPEFITAEWDLRYNTFGLGIAQGLINAIAWVFFVIPIVQISWLLSRGGTRMMSLHTTIGAMAFAGCLLELLARIMTIGASSTAQWLAQDFNLDNWIESEENDQIGWRSLEVSYTVARGMLVWIDAVEWMFLFVVMVLLNISIKRYGSNPPASLLWSRYGLFVGLLCFLAFASDILRLVSWKDFNAVTIFITIFMKLVFFPFWLLWMGRALYSFKETEANRHHSVQPGENVLAEAGQTAYHDSAISGSASSPAASDLMHRTSGSGDASDDKNPF